MKFVRPTVITDAVLTSTSVPETDHAAWASGTTYAAGDRVIRTQTHRRYESKVGGNAAHLPETSPDQWLDLGPTNRWAMFDQAVGTITTGVGSITMELQPGAVDALALLDLDASRATVDVTVGGSSIATREQFTAVGGNEIDNWFSWFFEPIGRRTALIFDDLPPYAGCVVTVTIAGATGSTPISVGTLLLGRQFVVGKLETGPEVGINDFSRKNTDDFGVTTVVERAYSGRATMRVQIDTVRADTIKRELTKLRAVPTLYIGEDGYDSLTLFGFFKTFTINLEAGAKSPMSIEIEGLT